MKLLDFFKNKAKSDRDKKNLPKKKFVSKVIPKHSFFDTSIKYIFSGVSIFSEKVKLLFLKIFFWMLVGISFIKKWIYKVGNGIKSGAFFVYKMTISGISKVCALIVGIASFFKSCVIAIGKSIDFGIRWVGNLIKLHTWLLIAISIILVLLIGRWCFERRYNLIFTDRASSGEFGNMLDQRLSVTQDELKKFIDQRFQKIDKQLDSIVEKDNLKKRKVDAKIKGEVKKQMASLKEDRLRKLINAKKREIRKQILKKMVEEES